MKGSYIGKVNGIDISKYVMLDNTKPDKNVIHVMIPKNALIQIADQINKDGQVSAGLMKFTLQPEKTTIRTGAMSRGQMGSTMSMSSMGSMPPSK